MASCQLLHPTLPIPSPPPSSSSSPSPPPPEDLTDFEFRLHDHPVAMLPADQLFSDGKLVPLHLSSPSPKPPRWRTLLLLNLKNHPNPSSSKPSDQLEHDHEDLPRNPLRVRISKPTQRGRASIDSPRMDGSGRVIFQGLERSTSSPGSFSGRPGMERSLSAHVRVPSVLNVPICSLRGGSKKTASVFGFRQIFSQGRKERRAVGSAAGGKKR